MRGFGRSEDTESTVRAMRALGVEIDDEGPDALRVHGVGLRGLRAPDASIDCGNAGTLVRLLAGILAGQQWRQFELTGDESLSTRPMGRIAEPLTQMGAGVETAGGHLPLGDRRPAAARDRVRAARRERPGQVLRAPGRALRRRRDHGRRARAHPRPHGADAPRRRARASRDGPRGV